MKEYYRGNFFANTPDILPPILQLGGRPAFRMRLVLAATLSSVYGIYSGFELCENTSARRAGHAGVLPGLRDVPAQGLGLGSTGQHRRRRHARQSHST